MPHTDFRKLPVLVQGLGLNGGGLETARFFVRQGAEVTVTDLKSAEELAPSVKALESEFPGKIRFVLEKHDVADFSRAALVIKGPGVKREGNPYLEAAQNIDSDIGVFLALTEAPVIGVTGSKGKSSTASCIHHILEAAGHKAFLGGNITLSPLSFLEETTPETPAVLELSSWQLADLRGRKLLHPHIAVITPIFSDHQNWYHGMIPYVADKKVIYENMTAQDYLVCSADEPWQGEFASETRAEFISINEGTHEYQAVAGTELLVAGKHTILNAAAALKVCKLYRVQEEVCLSALKTWGGLPHRLEYFYTKHLSNGGEAHFYNDTTATVPEAAAAALQAFGEPVHLISGGTDKGADFAVLAEELNRNPPLSLHVLEGTGTDRLLPLLKTPYFGPFSNLDELLNHLYRVLEEKKTKTRVIFSPGATSFGLFKNEFDRGDTFKSKVRTSSPPQDPG